MNDHTTQPEDSSLDKTASQRALELRKFFEPFYHSTSPSWNGGLDVAVKSDGALDAFAETVLWRLRGVRTLVSLIDRNTQYFVAGAVRQGKGQDDHVLLDQTWFGCNSISTTGGLCEHTLALDPTADKYPCFMVNDLREDERFAKLPVVDGSAMAYRFYAGTPITTDNNINIGTFFMFDDKPRPEGLTLEQRRYLTEAASKVMKHLETKREAAERRRVALMSKGIAKFLETTSHVTEADIEGSESSETSRKHSFARKNSSIDSARLSSVPSSPPEVPIAEEAENDETSKTSSSKVLDQIKLALDRAADILRESLELNSGGVLFLDTALGSKYAGGANDYFGINEHMVIAPEASFIVENKSLPVHETALSAFTSIDSIARGRSSPSQVRSFNDQYQPAKILAKSVSKNAHWNKSTIAPDGRTLQSLINTYPKGNVWYIDEEGYFSSIEQADEICEGQTPTPSGKRRSRPPFDMKRQRSEAESLSRVFQNARQIIFLPLWDAGGNRWYAGCFVWSQFAVPVFSVDPEIAYLSAFTNSMMVEISRLEAMTANKMKSDFISSISHEFRSPLHGILASTEFLRDSELDSMQAEFISTIQNCGSTLLDTINHVLDYSKINSFEKKGLETGSLSNELYQCSDVAFLCEEIVYGMMAAKEFTGIVDSSSPQRPTSHALHHLHDSQIHIILDFEPRDWKYRIQSGAIRRVIMNIFGNSIKYTDAGFITVQLQIREIEKVDPKTAENSCQHVLIMRVIDSGRGMSTEYMERKLYTPFAQEDSFSPGIGLGLSIVWSIINQLGGMIHIRSELGKGTDVEISLPLERENSNNNCSSMARPDIEVYRSVEAQQCVESVRMIARGKTAAILQDKTSVIKKRHSTDLKWKCIKRYLSEWFGFTIIDADDPKTLATADLIVGEKDGQYLKSFFSAHIDISRILLIRDGMTCVQEQMSCPEMACVENIWNPIGPYKLARAVMALFKQPSGAKPVIKSSLLEVPSQGSELSMLSTASSGTSSPNSGMKQSGSDVSSNSALDTDQGSEPIATKSVTDVVVKPDSIRMPEILTRSASGNMSTDAAQQFLAMLPPQALQSPNSTYSPTMLSPQIENDIALYVLAVDDNILNLQLLHRYLIKRPNDIVVTARNGVEAVAAVQQAKAPFDIILMDISMPDMDGFEATRLIRVFETSQRHREPSKMGEGVITSGKAARIAGLSLDGSGSNPLPPPPQEAPEIQEGDNSATDVDPPGQLTRAYIVALTGLASRRDRDEAEDSGFDDFLTKPISFTKIGELLARISVEKGKKND